MIKCDAEENFPPPRKVRKVRRKFLRFFYEALPENEFYEIRKPGILSIYVNGVTKNIRLSKGSSLGKHVKDGTETLLITRKFTKEHDLYWMGLESETINYIVKGS